MEELELQSSPQPICTGCLPDCFREGAQLLPHPEAPAASAMEAVGILGLRKKGLLKPSPPDPTQAGLQP